MTSPGMNGTKIFSIMVLLDFQYTSPLLGLRVGFLDISPCVDSDSISKNLTAWGEKVYFFFFFDQDLGIGIKKVTDSPDAGIVKLLRLASASNSTL